MKRTFLVLLVAFIIQSCMMGQPHGFEAYFCTTTASGEKGILYIDKKRIGELPYATVAPGCDLMPPDKVATYVPLTGGKHLVEIKTTDGQILFSEKLEVERKNGGSSIHSTVDKPEWDTKVKIKEDCLVIELIY